MNNTANPENYMKTAIKLARKARGRTSPNPMVGALVVKNGKIVGRGFHPEAGKPHAEVYALREAGDQARQATMYVTLEPCNHQGRTPPCSEAIIAAGIGRVVVGTRDPNPSVSGGGIERLRAAGIEVTVGVEEERCRRLIEAFSTAVTKGRCHVTMKVAVTLDGRIATKTGDAFWVSGPRALQWAHRLRNRLDALVVGAGTLRRDDPQGTCRLKRGRDPMRIVVAGGFDLPAEAKFFTARSGNERARVLLAVPRGAQGDPGPFEALGVDVVRLPAKQGKLSVEALCRHLLVEEGITSLLVEGGAELHGAFWDAKLVDRVSFVIAPKIVGGRQAVPSIGGKGIERMTEAVPIHDMVVHHLGPDLIIEGRPVWEQG